MTGYQQGILYLNGSFQHGTYTRFVVRNIDLHYVDAVSGLFLPSRPYFQRHNDPRKRDYWCIKSVHVSMPSLDGVSDWRGFCRAFVELQGCLDLWRHKNRKGDYLYTPRLRLYGSESDLLAVSSNLPAGAKKIQYVSTGTGKTCMLAYQSPAEVRDILDYIDGTPRNDALWLRWSAILSGKRPQ